MTPMERVALRECLDLLKAIHARLREVPNVRRAAMLTAQAIRNVESALTR